MLYKWLDEYPKHFADAGIIGNVSEFINQIEDVPTKQRLLITFNAVLKFYLCHHILYQLTKKKNKRK